MSSVKSIQTIEEEKNIINYLKNSTLPENLNSKQKFSFKERAQLFRHNNGSLYLLDLSIERNDKLVIPSEKKDLIKNILIGEHEKNHYGMNKMFEIVKKKYFGINRDRVREVVKACLVCQKAQPFKNKKKNVRILANFALERIQFDLVDLSEYKNQNDQFRYLLNIIDVYSKYLVSYPLKDKSGPTVLKSLKKFCFSYGYPKIAQSDNGTEFINSEIRDFWKNNNVVIRNSRPRNPQANSQVERVNQTITRSISKFCDEKNSKRYIDSLDEIVYFYNISYHRGIKKSPFKVFFRRDGFNTVLFEKNSDSNDSEILESNEKYFENIELKQIKSNDNFNVGDFCLKKTDFDKNIKTKKRKLDNFNEGPFEITEKLNDFTFIIKINEGKTEKVNITQIKKVFK